MKLKLLQTLCAISLVTGATSCFDDNYDLSDIDTTSRITVDNLVIPVNIDQIKMSSVIELNEDDDIKIIDGEYAYTTDGDFDSDPIKVDGFHIAEPDIKPSEANFKLGELLSGAPARVMSSFIPYEIENPVQTEMKLNAKNISDKILGVEMVYMESDLSIDIPMNSFSWFVTEVNLRDFTFVLPANLLIDDPNYDAETGAYTLGDRTVPTNEPFKLNIKIHGIGITSDQFSAVDHTLNIDEFIGVTHGMITIPLDKLSIDLSELESNLKIKISYRFCGTETSDINIDSVTGTMQYAIDDLDINDIDISGLPDVLAQPGTNLVFANPRIYMHLNNPLQQYGLYAQTGLGITAIRDGKADASYDLPEPFKIGKPAHADGLYNFCLSPLNENTENAEYPDAQWVEYTALSQVFSNNDNPKVGIPERLKINIVDPQIPAQRVEKLQLGVQYPKIAGTYSLIAPLQLGVGSTVCYKDTVDGWSDEDVDKMTIQRLEVKLSISTDIPLAVDFTGYPIDKNRKQINGVEIKGAQINAMAQNQEVTIIAEGEIKNLDGIIFKAVASSADNGKPLSPDMTITVNNVRPCVSGYYETDF